MYFWNKTLPLRLGDSKLYKKQTVMYLLRSWVLTVIKCHFSVRKMHEVM